MTVRFNGYSFGRQIQRFALAQFFFSTKRRSWNQSMGWLTDIDVCSWYQINNTNPCVDGTLQVLALVENNLNGTISNDIGLIGTLKVLALRSNRLTGSVPFKIKSITSLKSLDLQHNLIDEFPTSLPQTMKVLQLSSSKTVGMRPKEVFINLSIMEILDVSRCNLTCDTPDNIKYLIDILGLWKETPLEV
jgi:hypothetical protein